MYLLNYVHKLTTGLGENGVDVEIRKINGDTLIDTIATEGSEVDGRVTYSQNGSPGRVYLKVTQSGKTRIVYGDVSLQRYGGWSDADLFELRKMLGDGVVDILNTLVVGSPLIAGRSVSVDTGMAMGKGVAYVQRTKTDYAVTANVSGSTRTDSIVVRFTLTGADKWTAEIVVKAGDVTITDTTDTFEIQLATIEIASGASALTGANVTDKRYIAGSQGFVFKLPSTRTAGDLFYVGTDGKVTRLGIGTTGQYLRTTAGIPTWDTLTADDVDGTVSATEFGYLANVTSDIQTQLTAKAASVHTHAQSDVTNLVSDLAAKQPLDSDLTTIAANITAAGHAILDDANAAAQRTTLGAAPLDNPTFTTGATVQGTLAVTGNSSLGNASGDITAITGTLTQTGNYNTVGNVDVVGTLDVQSDSASAMRLRNAAGTADTFIVDNSPVPTLRLPNGTDIKGYSDALTTETWSIDGATGALQLDGDLTMAGTLTATGDSALGNSSTDTLTIGGQIETIGSGPTLTVGANAGSGTGDSASKNWGSDTAGQITLVSGSTASNGSFLTLTWASARSSSAYAIILFPANNAAAGLGLYNDEASNTVSAGFIRCSTGMAVGTTYIFNYLVIS